MQLREHERSYRLSFPNGIALEIVKRADVFGGLGEVRWRRRKLRSAELPIMPLIRTPDGHEVIQLRFRDLDERGDALVLSLTPYVVPGGPMAWAPGDCEDRWNVASWARQAERDRGGRLLVTIRPVDCVLGGVSFVGFSYAYRFRSRRYSVHRIHDRATWELGGRATGNSFWMAGPGNEPQKTFRNKDDAYSTAWYRESPGSPQLVQFLPFFSALQGFTFQFDARNLLVTAFESAFHCRSLFQKSAGRNCLVHWHQLCGDLGECQEFPGLMVLYGPGAAGSTPALFDRYCAIREELHRRYADQCGLVREGAVVSSRMVPREGSGAEALERGLDELARAGCARVYVPGLVKHFRPATASAKAARDARRRVRRVIDHAHERGLEVAASLEDCCAPWLMEPAAAGSPTDAPVLALGAGEEGPIGAALRDGRARRALLEHLRHVRRSAGVDALFAATSWDGAASQFEWSPFGQDRSRRGRGARSRPAAEDGVRGGRVRSLFRAHVGLLTELQRIGYRCASSSVAGLAEACARVPYDALRGCEFMYRDRTVEFPHEAIVERDVDPLSAYFRGCAQRVAYLAIYEAARGMRGRLAAWWTPQYAAVNKAYHAVREHMECSLTLPEERGVVWSGSDPDVRVLWCYRPFKWQVGDHVQVFDVMASRRVEAKGGEFAAQPLTVYLVQTVADA